MTGVQLEGTPTTIEARQAELMALHSEIFNPGKKEAKGTGPSRTLNLADSEIIAKAKAAQNGDKFDRLMGGDISEYDNDDNRADLALCSILAFWTQNRWQIDRIFRASGLMRDKWDRLTAGSTYGLITIDKAIAGTTETYQSPGAYRNGQGTRTAGPQEKEYQAEQTKATKPAPKPIIEITAADLSIKEFPQPRWAVKKLVPEGYGVIGGRPKIGKSCFAWSWL